MNRQYGLRSQSQNDELTKKNKHDIWFDTFITIYIGGLNDSNMFWTKSAFKVWEGNKR